LRLPTGLLYHNFYGISSILRLQLSLSKAELSGQEARQANAESLREFPPVKTKLHDAQKQLGAYRQALQKTYGDKLKLRSFAIVSIGFERLLWTELT
jgi:hypothetical protein